MSPGVVNVGQLLVGFGLSVIASVISAVVTVRLSLSRFRSERWWEKKAEAYSRLIEELALFQVNSEWWGVRYDLLLATGVLPRTEAEDKLAKEAQELRSSLKKTVAIGAYIISDEAAEALGTLREEFEKAEAAQEDGDPQSWSEANAIELEATKKCITKLRDCAKSDLGMRR